MELLSVLVFLFCISVYQGALIVEEEDTIHHAIKETSVSIEIEKESEQMLEFLKSFLRKNPNKHSKGFFDGLEDCLLLSDKKEEAKPEFIFSIPPEDQCVTLGDSCSRSGNFRDDFDSFRQLDISISSDKPPPPRPPPQRPPPPTRCCNFTLCRSQKCCIPTASNAQSPACSSNDDCCDAGVCDTDFSRLCKVASQGTCTRNEQCVKGSCQEGKCCINPLDACHACESSNDCCGSGPCVGGKCLAKNGNYCNSGTQCASGTCCSSNTCGLPTPTPPDLLPGTLQKCKANSDCCDSGLCETTSGTCRFPDAFPCKHDYECIHNKCYNNEKCCYDTNQGDQCVDARTYCCYSQAVCRATTLPNGNTIYMCGNPTQ